MLLARETEQQVVDELLRSARTGRSSVLVLRGAARWADDSPTGGAEPIVGPPLARGAVEGSFRARVAALPQPVRTGLLLAAVEQSGDPADARTRDSNGPG
jgi:hypothetical protein